jgi:acyl transferase domain-containing protein
MTAAPCRLDAVAYLFGAQGTQWAGMGGELLACDATFRDTIAACEQEIHRHADWSLTEEMAAPRAVYRLHNDHRFIQPALTAVQIGLVRMLGERGLKASAVASLSMGEAAAAHVAGRLDLLEAMDIACAVSRLPECELPPGLMAVIRAPWTRAGDFLANLGARVSLAVELSRDQYVISGERQAVEIVLARAAAQGLSARPLPLAQPYHWQGVSALRSSFVQALSGLQPRPGRIPLYSSATGQRHEGVDGLANHWWAICSAPARFLDVARAMVRDGFRRFIEIGPHPMLEAAIRDAAAELGVTTEFHAVMVRESGLQHLEETVARLLARIGVR